jgi:organic hydroperoxide reductase OsmC/OhrA
MHPFPHTYRVQATLAADGDARINGERLPQIATAAPPEFDGPGDRWSPEMLLLAALADCFVLSFRAVSRAARLEFQHLDCGVEGVLDRVGGFAQFSEFRTLATLTVAPDIDPERARKLLEKAEHACLIARSLKGTGHLECVIVAGTSSA